MGRHCDKSPTPDCVNLTISSLRRIETAFAAYPGPRYHILGNHDVDILNQSSVLQNEANSAVDEQGGPGYYSWSFPPGQRRRPLRFIALNGDFTDKDVAWKDLDSPWPGESWDKANVPTAQRCVCELPPAPRPLMMIYKGAVV